ncbi:MAG: biotin/lipoyl-binding protein [Clostridia bacterium]|nr:biotin/lipoyl-binding protein [Clostridia bacterium]
MRKFNVTVDGVTYEVEVEEIGGAVVQAPVTVAPVAAPVTAPVAPVQKASAPAPAKAAPKAVAGGSPIKAPMPGNIVKLLVADGATVTKGQAIIVLEAMKMENDIVADKDGVVNFVVKAGDTVETGATIATIA